MTPWGLQDPRNGKKASGQAGDLYKERMEDGSTFRFEYVYTYAPEQTGNGSGETGTAASSTGLFPVRGLTAVFLFITGLYSAVTAAEDSRRGLFIPLPVRLRVPCRFAALAAPCGPGGPVRTFCGAPLGRTGNLIRRCGGHPPGGGGHGPLRPCRFHFLHGPGSHP